MLRGSTPAAASATLQTTSSSSSSAAAAAVWSGSYSLQYATAKTTALPAVAPKIMVFYRGQKL